jgi:HK97 family phage prohead protease
MSNEVKTKDSFIGKKAEVVVKGLEVVSENSEAGVITIGGYANRFLDENGNLVVDRSNESVLPEAYDLKSFMKNPVLLYQHRQDEIVGKVINIDVRRDGLYIEAEVHRKMNEKVFYAVENGILKTFSIGFLIRDVKEVDDIYFWTDIELLEVSIVGVPDNQESLFSVLTDSPCGSGVCLLANRATPVEKVRKALEEKAINNQKVSTKPWSEVNKTELKQKLEEEGNTSYIKEAFLVVRDVEKRSTWKFPHHEYTNGELVVNRGGVVSAYAALKGARNEPAISTAEKKDAAKHLLKHYRVLKEQGHVDEIPEDLINMAKEFEELYQKEIDSIKEELEGDMETKEIEQAEIETKEGETDNGEQTKEEDTIDNPETKNEDGGADQEADSDEKSEETAEEGETEKESSDSSSEESGVDALKNFINEAKNTTEGLNTLLELYLEIEGVLNEALTQNEN